MTWLIVLMFQVHGDFWFRQLWVQVGVVQKNAHGNQREVIVVD